MKRNELLEKLDRQVEILNEARIEAGNCKRQVSEMKESLDIATVNAVTAAMSNEEDQAMLTHKSPDVRNGHRDKIIKESVEVQMAKQAIKDAECRALDAELELDHQKDIWLAIRLEIRLLAAELEYMSETPDKVAAF
jgi:hypothetical protein